MGRRVSTTCMRSPPCPSASPPAPPVAAPAAASAAAPPALRPAAAAAPPACAPMPPAAAPAVAALPPAPLPPAAALAASAPSHAEAVPALFLPPILFASPRRAPSQGWLRCWLRCRWAWLRRLLWLGCLAARLEGREPEGAAARWLQAARSWCQAQRRQAKRQDVRAVLAAAACWAPVGSAYCQLRQLAHCRLHTARERESWQRESVQKARCAAHTLSACGQPAEAWLAVADSCRPRLI